MFGAMHKVLARIWQLGGTDTILPCGLWVTGYQVNNGQFSKMKILSGTSVANFN